MKTKKCTKCGEVKDVGLFSPDNRNNNGLQSWCKECINRGVVAAQRTLVGHIGVIYRQQKVSSLRRGHKQPSYPLGVLTEWAIGQRVYHAIHERWKNSDYDIELSPSFDRLNDSYGYSLKNIRIVTWRENRDRYYDDVVKGINTKRCKAVMQFTKDGVFVAEYYSIAQAYRDTGVSRGAICEACKGLRVFAGGFVWRYKVL